MLETIFKILNIRRNKKIIQLLFLANLIFISDLFGKELNLHSINVIPLSGSVDSSYSISVRIKNLFSNRERITLYQMREDLEVIPILLIKDKKENEPEYEIFTGKGYVPKTAALGIHEFTVFIVDDNGKKSNFLKYKFNVTKK